MSGPHLLRLLLVVLGPVCVSAQLNASTVEVTGCCGAACFSRILPNRTCATVTPSDVCGSFVSDGPYREISCSIVGDSQPPAPPGSSPPGTSLGDNSALKNILLDQDKCIGAFLGPCGLLNRYLNTQGIVVLDGARPFFSPNLSQEDMAYLRVSSARWSSDISQKLEGRILVKSAVLDALNENLSLEVIARLKNNPEFDRLFDDPALKNPNGTLNPEKFLARLAQLILSTLKPGPYAWNPNANEPAGAFEGLTKKIGSIKEHFDVEKDSKLDLSGKRHDEMKLQGTAWKRVDLPTLDFFKRTRHETRSRQFAEAIAARRSRPPPAAGPGLRSSSIAAAPARTTEEIAGHRVFNPNPEVQHKLADIVARWDPKKDPDAVDPATGRPFKEEVDELLLKQVERPPTTDPIDWLQSKLQEPGLSPDEKGVLTNLLELARNLQHLDPFFSLKWGWGSDTARQPLRDSDLIVSGQKGTPINLEENELARERENAELGAKLATELEIAREPSSHPLDTLFGSGGAFSFVGSLARADSNLVQWWENRLTDPHANWLDAKPAWDLFWAGTEKLSHAAAEGPRALKSVVDEAYGGVFDKNATAAVTNVVATAVEFAVDAAPISARGIEGVAKAVRAPEQDARAMVEAIDRATSESEMNSAMAVLGEALLPPLFEKVHAVVYGEKAVKGALAAAEWEAKNAKLYEAFAEGKGLSPEALKYAKSYDALFGAERLEGATAENLRQYLVKTAEKMGDSTPNKVLYRPLAIEQVANEVEGKLQVLTKDLERVLDSSLDNQKWVRASLQRDMDRYVMLTGESPAPEVRTAFDKLTKAVEQKVKILTDAGLSPPEAKALIRSGIAGEDAAEELARRAGTAGPRGPPAAHADKVAHDLQQPVTVIMGDVGLLEIAEVPARLTPQELKLFQQAKKSSDEIAKAIYGSLQEAKSGALHAVDANYASLVKQELNPKVATLQDSMAQLLESSRGRLKPDEIRFLETAQRKADDLARNLEQLGEGRFTALRRDVSPADLFGRAAEDWQDVARLKKVALKVEGVEDLPKVFADPARVDQVLGNLLSNAFKFAPEGSEIVLRAEAREGAVLFQVSNRGQMSEKVLSELFQEFKGGTERPGTGLGLTNSKELVELQGGKIWAENALEGAEKRVSFKFTLPEEGRAGPYRLAGTNTPIELARPPPGKQAEALKALVGDQIGVQPDLLELKPLGGASGGSVFDVQVKGESAGIFKVFAKPDGAKIELEALKLLESKGLRGLAGVEERGILDLVIGGEPKSAMLMHNAGTSIADRMAHGLTARELSELKTGMDRVAEALAELHAPAGELPLAAKDLRVRYILGKFDGLALPPGLKAELDPIVAALKERVIPEYRAARLMQTAALGDANPGNFILRGDKVVAIDVGSLLDSLSERGMGVTGLHDAGRFYEALEQYGAGLKPAELKALREEFLSAYLKKTGIPPEDAMAAIRLERVNTELAALRSPSLTEAQRGQAIERLRKIVGVEDAEEAAAARRAQILKGPSDAFSSFVRKLGLDPASLSPRTRRGLVDEFLRAHPDEGILPESPAARYLRGEALNGPPPAVRERVIEQCCLVQGLTQKQVESVLEREARERGYKDLKALTDFLERTYVKDPKALEREWRSILFSDRVGVQVFKAVDPKSAPKLAAETYEAARQALLRSRLEKVSGAELARNGDTFNRFVPSDQLARLLEDQGLVAKNLKDPGARLTEAGPELITGRTFGTPEGKGWLMGLTKCPTVDCLGAGQGGPIRLEVFPRAGQTYVNAAPYSAHPEELEWVTFDPISLSQIKLYDPASGAGYFMDTPEGAALAKRLLAK